MNNTETCDALSITNGQILCEDDPATVGLNCNVTCDDGYIESVDAVICQSGNTWSDQPTCQGTDNLEECEGPFSGHGAILLAEGKCMGTALHIPPFNYFLEFVLLVFTNCVSPKGFKIDHFFAITN